MSIRAYKLAEELGIERNEFVEKARALGIELKNPMASVVEEDVETLRIKLGSATAERKDMVERRVASKSGSTVIRRRKRAVEPEPSPPAAAVEESEAVTPELVAAQDGKTIGEEVTPVAESPVEEGEAPAVEAEAAVSGNGTTPKSVADSGPAGPSAPSSPRVGASAQPAAPAGDEKNKQRKRVREVVNLREQEQFARQIVNRGGPQRRSGPAGSARSVTSPRRKRRDAPAKKVARPVTSGHKTAIKVQGDTSVGELAKLLGVKAPQIQGKLMALGTMLSVNQLVDVETIHKLAIDMGFEIQDVGFKEQAILEEAVAPGAEEAANQEPRPPIITVMGHVDHGKTSLLDAIRKTAVVDGESGGITQHIGAYQTSAAEGLLTFIDTPGHAAFTAMRSRGAQVTDIVVLVVAATDGVMPQTVEAIEHTRAAGCPLVVAINKCDLPGADPQQARQRLMEHELVPEEYGGDTVCVDVSAMTGQGLDQLLEMLVLQAELLELKADPSKRANGVVLEARLDRGRGVVATALVKEGTLKAGDTVVCGRTWGRVRMMENDRGTRINEAPPATPVQVIGLGSVPEAGATFHVVENERAAKQVVAHREAQDRTQVVAKRPVVTLEEFLAQSEGEEVRELPLVLKADVHGTCEAVRDSLEKLSTDAVKLKVISAGVGAVSENDVMLASASGAIVVGFHVRPEPAARKAADANGVDIRSYQIIYELIDEVRAAMAGLLPPTIKETALGRAEVRETFVIPKMGTVAGCLVTEGVIRRSASCRLVRDGVQIYEGKLGSLRRFKDDAREVQNGLECGMGIAGYNDVKIGDAIEVFELEEEPATL